MQSVERREINNEKINKSLNMKGRIGWGKS